MTHPLTHPHFDEEERNNRLALQQALVPGVAFVWMANWPTLSNAGHATFIMSLLIVMGLSVVIGKYFEKEAEKGN